MKTKIRYKQKSKKQFFVKENVSPLSAYQPKNDTINWKKKKSLLIKADFQQNALQK